MDKKLKKYIKRYDKIEDCTSHELMPNGGMIVLINQETNCEVSIDNTAYKLESFQAVLLNAYEVSVHVASNEELNLMVVRFKGAGASFFYEEQMDELMQVPKEPIFIEENILENGLDTYFKNHLKPSKLPFNIMKIIDLLDEQGSDYNIDEVLAIANVPRKILDKIFNLRTGLTFKTYASLSELSN
ncbi:MAG: Unknown protein [uncultured Sulfurovum sp.]|uniref:AraC family transcriptional regulator n=1 Tax=uncultured Sulfurovum sp. TaxID=269237 RepID=A0A6S6SHY4_9BACT|nr:MAG: Unknown protein [uncultured Sulfurovum sp.]